MNRVLVLGYYYKNNLGDDIFQYVFSKYVFANGSYDVTIVNLDNLESIVNDIRSGKIETFDYVIVGGGDLINDYYFNPSAIQTIRTTFEGTPLIFYGIGLSYPDLLPILDIGDHFFMRNKPDYAAVKSRYTSYFSYYTPDLAYFLMNEPLLKNADKRVLKTPTKIGVCLPYTWFANENQNNNQKFYEQIVELLQEYSQSYELHIIPFDTSNNSMNSDVMLLNKLRVSLSAFEYDTSMNQRIYYHQQSSDTLENRITRMIELFNSLDIVFASRFHSVILSILTDTPFVSLYTTRKINNIKYELPNELTQLFVEANVDSSLVPISFDKNKFNDAFRFVVNNYASLVTTIYNKKLGLFDVLKKSNRKLLTVLEKEEYSIRFAPPQYISQTEKDEMVTRTIANVLKVIDKWSVKNQKLVESNFPLSKIISRRKTQSTGHVEKVITEEILWSITNDPYAPYYYGLFDSVLDSGLPKRLSWVVEDYYLRFKYKSFSSKWITMMNKNFQELHRSGWQFIVDNIVMELHQDHTINKPLIIDTYVDKTFHWNKTFYSDKGAIPYKEDWIGFIHHTYSFYNNHYNCDVLFRDDLFRQSLENCKCLIVMSKYLKAKIEQSLQELYDHPTNPLRNRVTLEAIYHPSETTENTFDWDTFVSQPERQVVQIGNWLRNVHAIYQLQVPENSLITKKTILKNRNSENYFPPEGFLDTLFQTFNWKNKPFNNVYDICKISFENMHVKGLYEHVVDMETSVETIEHLDNDSYDDLLAKNIVFIQLVDASAVNTIIECILRNTPILVNPIEPVVELLGQDYPYYYTSMYEASKLLEDPIRMQAAHNYLCSYDKSRFYISSFINQMKAVITRYTVITSNE